MDARTAVIASLGAIAPETDFDNLDPDADLRDELDLDSMDFLNFVIGLHDLIGIEVPERDYPQMLTLDMCVRYLDAALAKQ
ncbi:MAG TPA: acyl carrier protein [Acidimicrobiales bacterium]|nr:acyl carrier protein [Acidimicrobiales bacterium]